MRTTLALIFDNLAKTQGGEGCAAGGAPIRPACARAGSLEDANAVDFIDRTLQFARAYYTNPQISKTSYDRFGDVIASLAPNGQLTKYLVDGDAETTETIDFGSALPEISTVFFDGLGNETGSIDPSGLQTDFAVNGLGQTTLTTVGVGSASPQTTQDLYDGFGEVTASIDPLGNKMLEFFENDGEVVGTVEGGSALPTNYTLGYFLANSGTWQVNQSLFDAFGETTESIDPDGVSTLFDYNADGEVTGTIEGAELTAGWQMTTSLFDAGGNVTESIDPLGRTVLDYYDDQDNLTVEVVGTSLPSATADYFVANPTSASWQVTQYFYDADGNLTLTVDPLGDNSQLYDDFGDVTSTIQGMELASSLWRVTDTTRTTAGDATGTVEAANLATALQDDQEDVYDGNGNLIQSTDWDGKVTRYDYNADNQLAADHRSFGWPPRIFMMPFGNYRDHRPRPDDEGHCL